MLGVREAQLAPYGEFWVASSDIDSGDLRIEFQGPAIEPGAETDSALVVAGYATVTPLLGIVGRAAQGCGRIGRERRLERRVSRTQRALIAAAPRTLRRFPPPIQEINL